MVFTGCGSPPDDSQSNQEQLRNRPRAQVFSECGIQMTLPKWMRIEQRNPEDHELKMANRPGQPLVRGRITVIHNPARKKALGDILQGIVREWSRPLKNPALAAPPDPQNPATQETLPVLVPNFHPLDAQGVKIAKVRMVTNRRIKDEPYAEPFADQWISMAYLVEIDELKLVVVFGMISQESEEPGKWETRESEIDTLVKGIRKSPSE